MFAFLQKSVFSTKTHDIIKQASDIFRENEAGMSPCPNNFHSVFFPTTMLIYLFTKGIWCLGIFTYERIGKIYHQGELHLGKTVYLA